jgi:hypothetical protein
MGIKIMWDKNAGLSDQIGFWFAYSKPNLICSYPYSAISFGYSKYGIDIDSHLNICIYNIFATGCGG